MKKRLEDLGARVVERLIGLTIPDARDVAEQPCILFSCHDVDRGLQRDGRYFSPLLEPVAEHCRRRGKHVANLSHPVTVYRSGQVRGSAVSINRAFLRDLAIERGEATLLGESQARARGRLRRVSLYRDLLRRLKVERVFSIEPPRELCKAGRELGIPVIEAIHGMNLNASNLDFRARVENIDDRLLPSVYMAFDSSTHAALDALLQGRSIRAVAMPHPWHVEVHREHSPLRADPVELDALLRRYRAAFLITLQWGYAGELGVLSSVIPNGIMHPALEQAITSSPADVLWLVRLHPVQIKRRKYGAHRAYVADLARRCANVETALASSLPLPMLLPRCHGHITMISTAAGEAAQLGVPSLMLCPTLKPGGAHAGVYSELFEAGTATLGELDGAEILRWVAARAEQPPGAMRRDWRQDAIELERRLDELLELAPKEGSGRGE